jgi:ParB family protein of integrating conjugative element (PFGI_1 class)
MSRATGGPPDQRAASPLASIPVGRIRAYERNPRHSENPAYGEIKESIRVDGMLQPLIVTRRPDDEDYVVAAGGNTRLRAIRELHTETEEERFARVPCVIHPWTGEKAVLAGHLKENDLRGDLVFIDRARAVLALLDLIREDQSGAPLSQRQAVAALRDVGYVVSQSVFSYMAYAVERLWSLLPNALAAGIGRRQIERIRILERSAESVWTYIMDADPEVFATAFDAACRKSDGAVWDFAVLRRAVEEEITRRADVDPAALQEALAARLDERAAKPDDAAEPEFANTASPGHLSSVGTASARDLPPDPYDIDNQDSAQPNVDYQSDGQPTEPRRESEEDTGHDMNTKTAQHPATSDQSRPPDLKTLRARAWTLAQRIAQRHGLETLVAPLIGKGLGYMICDVPDAALLEQLDQDELAQVSTAWWQLAACAEVTVAPLAEILPLVQEGSVLRRALEDQDAGLLFDSVWTLDPGNTGYRLWRRLDDRAWQDLCGLMENYRDLHRVAETTGSPLWG